MFTGIVRHVGSVLAVESTAGGRRLTIDLGPLADGLAAGDSVAVAGACLTAAQATGRAGRFDVVAETLSRTTLGSVRPGSKVNLERPVALGDALHGHLIQGHVDGTAEVRAVRRGGPRLVDFATPRELTVQMVPKGSVAVDGVSLTLVDVGEGTFRVALVPTTLAKTTLGDLRAGQKVNVETDLLGKYVRRWLDQIGPAQKAPGITLAKLRQAGFD